MSRLVVSTDASVLTHGAVGIGYVVERVGDDGEQVEMLVKECDDVSPERFDDHHEAVHEAEYLAVVRGVEAAMEHLDDDERLVMRCDNRQVVGQVRVGRDWPDDLQERLIDCLENVEWEIRDIPRTLNSLADSLSKQASRGKVR
ncbi:RNase HI [Halovirus HCTV-5]|uniref:Rnase H n=1 Tax=Halovirus HCTV-5 TaxID=1273748 RepID=UPI00033485D5|nr:Rnase H [Halovirus HCTV-5]AGM11777.1 RNase HI [Halovirus HCTV-5]